jgi:tetratricopeptide (TPR) repeat protein
MVNRLFAILLAFSVFTGCNREEDFFSEGLDLSAEGNFTAAIQKFDKAILENPFLKDAYLQMGLCYDHLNKHDSAIQAYDRLLYIYPDNTAGSYYSGVSRCKLKKYSEAVFYFNKALDSKGGFDATDTNSVQASLDLYKDHFETESAEMDIPCCEILYDRAMAHYKSGHYKNALADFSNCILQNHNTGTSYYMIGLCRLARKEFKSARQAFQRASNLGDTLSLKKLSFLENANPGMPSSNRKKV